MTFWVVLVIRGRYDEVEPSSARPQPSLLLRRVDIAIHRQNRLVFLFN